MKSLINHFAIALTIMSIPISSFSQGPGLCLTFPPNAVQYQTGASPYGITADDLNNDIHKDLAITNYTSGDLSILLGNGNGTFAPTVNYNVGTHPVSITSADFNGDGIKDLAVAHSNPDSLSVLIGSGNGIFGLPAKYTVGSNPRGVKSGDFNNDGYIDLVVCNYGSTNISVLLGNGTGIFAAAVNYPTAVKPFAIICADFNGDNITDIAAASLATNSTSVLIGTGTGSFAAPVTYSVASITFSINYGDFDADGNIDLAVPGYNTGNVSILLGSGSGTFSTATNYVSGLHPYSVAVADFNGDNKTDLVLSDGNSKTCNFLLNAGPATFTQTVNYTGTFTQDAIVAADFNNDGMADLAQINYNNNTVTIVMNNQIPVVTISSLNSICPGESVYIKANGALTYSWSNGGAGDSILVNPVTNTSYTVVGTGANGCSDSAIENIIMKPMPDVNVSINNLTLSSVQSGATYQWLNCYANQSPIVGETNQSYIITQTGGWSVSVTLNGCTDTSACIYINILDVPNPLQSNNELEIYPNPGSGKFSIASTNIKYKSLSIFNSLGELVFKTTDSASEINLDREKPGVYFVHIHTADKTIVKKIVIE